MACFSYTTTRHRFGWLIIELKKSLIPSVVMSGLSVILNAMKNGMFMIALDRDLRPVELTLFPSNRRQIMCVRGNTSESSITPSQLFHNILFSTLLNRSWLG